MYNFDFKYIDAGRDSSLLFDFILKCLQTDRGYAEIRQRKQICVFFLLFSHRRQFSHNCYACTTTEWSATMCAVFSGCARVCVSLVVIVDVAAENYILGIFICFQAHSMRACVCIWVRRCTLTSPSSIIKSSEPTIVAVKQNNRIETNFPVANCKTFYGLCFKSSIESKRQQNKKAHQRNDKAAMLNVVVAKNCMIYYVYVACRQSILCNNNEHYDWWTIGEE